MNNLPNSLNSSIISSKSSHLYKERQVLILYTGGTIGMVKNDHGLAPRKKFLYDYCLNHPNLCDKELTQKLILNNEKQNYILNMSDYLITPEINSERRTFYKIYEFEEIIDSSNMNMEYWKLIGRSVQKFYNDFDGFIILHGTDTMNYTACVLSFMLENLNKPVILTGSQIPLIEIRNDALKNLIDALTIAGTYHIPEVTLMFDSQLFRGNRTIKNDNMGLSAFESPNLCPLVTLGINIKVNWDIILSAPTEEFDFFEDFDNRITVIKFFPIIKDSTFESFFKPPIKAVIMETYGAGTFPTDRVKIHEIISNANKNGIIVVNVAQCRKGSHISSDMEKLFQSIGVIYAGDITVECCLAKLSYLLGKKYDTKKIQALLQESLRGEVSIIQPPEIFSLHSKPFVNALVSLMNNEKKSEENYIIATTLLPTVISELVENASNIGIEHNLSLLKKLEKVIKRINFNDFSSNKKTPLHFAAINGCLEIVEFLLKCRLNINQIDDENFTPLNHACINHHRELALYLKLHGAILNQPKDMGDFLCSLAHQGDLETIKLLYECGANLMLGDYDKRTLAHVAASEGKNYIIEFLINDTNVNIMVEDRRGKTPYDDALNLDIERIIKNKFKVVKVKINHKIQSKKNQKKHIRVNK
jgi:lysophospholipase